MVKWENEDAQMMAASTDPTIMKLREGMKYVEYQVIPELKDVYGGNLVVLEWYITLETAIHLKYVTADGKAMVCRCTSKIQSRSKEDKELCPLGPP